jgi:amino acid transporter
MLQNSRGSVLFQCTKFRHGSTDFWLDPGSFAEYVTTGTLGRFEGFLGAFFQASFTIVGPEYISMVAGEAIYPRVTIKEAFKTVYWRFAIFFIGGALCVGIVLPYNDPTLNALLDGGNTGTAASSPYVSPIHL